MRQTLRPRVVEWCGTPGGGKSTLIRAVTAAYPDQVSPATLDMYARGPEFRYALQFALKHPIACLTILAFVCRHHVPGLFAYSLHLAFRAAAKYEKAKESKTPYALIDEGIVHAFMTLPEKPLTSSAYACWFSHLPLPNLAYVASSGSFKRFHNEEADLHPRVKQGSAALASWEAAVRANVIAAREGLREVRVPIENISAERQPIEVLRSMENAPQMNNGSACRRLIIVGVFGLVALCGTLLSLSAPYIKSDDEIVYLTGALEAREGNLPDAHMLAAYDYGPYLYPKVMRAWYEPLGRDVFKTLYLFFLVLTTGIAAYLAFRLLWLSWIPALLLALVALMPRFASGLEIFGTFTFRDAIGRASATPLFFLATAFLVRQIAYGRRLWPVFFAIGLGIFLHPVSVVLFAAASLMVAGVVLLWRGARFTTVLVELLTSSTAFIVGGSYFFIEVIRRLAHSSDGERVTGEQFVEALLLRNQWDYFAAVVDWFPHMLVVSALFIVLALAPSILPPLKRLRARALPQAQLLVMWGSTLALGSLALAVVLPYANLYLIEHANAPYIFQQWSRTAKFYYLGIFIVAIPAVHLCWIWVKEQRRKWAVVVLATLVGMGSSTVGFEMTQFAIGYSQYDKAYVPQRISGQPDDMTPDQYHEICEALRRLGASSADEVISGDFALRYYCRANLYVTLEEGAAYQLLSRADFVAWYERIQMQRAALRGPTEGIRRFAAEVPARFLVLPKRAGLDFAEAEVVETASHMVIRLDQ